MKKQTKVLATLSAAALLAVGFTAVSFASGWDNSTGAWQYLDSDGEPVTNEWKQSNGQYFYLGDDGNMVTDSLIEDNSQSKPKYYYVDANGARVTNTWKAVALDGDENTDRDAEYWWYYFGSDGKAYTIDADKDLSKGRLKTINGLKYAFDDEGHMLYGWINATDKDQQDDNKTAWQNSDYYFNGWNDGHAQNGWIKLEVEKDNGDIKNYWFYFEDGKKQKGKKNVNGKTYLLDENDGHMLDDWGVLLTNSTVTSINGLNTTSQVRYLNGDGSVRKNKWVYAIPDEDYNVDGTNVNEDYGDDNYRWWYFNQSGKLTSSTMKKINGKWYLFDQAGRMKVGFGVTESDSKDYKDAFDHDKYSYADFTDGTVDRRVGGGDLYYFSSDEEKDGSRKTGYQTIELEDDKYQFYFDTKTGKAVTGYVSKIKKYTVNGLILKPSTDDDTNYVAISVGAGTDNKYATSDDVLGAFGTFTGDEAIGKVLVNKSGTIVKSKTKLKTSDDHYYVVDSKGIVVDYCDDEDQWKAHWSDKNSGSYIGAVADYIK
jgi:glucan-binding YG repeat protein